MKKREITYQKAIEEIKRGQAVECQLSYREDNTEIVRKEDRLKYLYARNQDGTQLCKIYLISQEKVKLPENAIEVSFDEAYEMVGSGELMYYKDEGEEEEITTIAELINLRRKYETQGKSLLLYWYE